MFSKRRPSTAEQSTKGKQASAAPVDSLVAEPQTKPSAFDVSEWSLRRKVALVLAVPVLLAGTFGGLRVRTERAQADNYAATATQVTVLGPAIEYLVAAEHAAIVARQVGINDPKLEAAQQEVVAAGARLVDARDKAELTPKQLAQVNTVLTLSEQMRTGMAYVSVASSVSQVRQLERGVTQIITTIVDAQIKPEERLIILAQALDGRLSLSLQQIQVSGSSTVTVNPAELYTELGVELAAIDRLAIALGQTDPLVLQIRGQNAQRVVNARAGNTKITGDDVYVSYDALIDEQLTTIDNNLAKAARDARLLTLVDSAIIGAALLAAIILALLVSRLLINPIRRVRTSALEVAHQRLPEAVAKIRAGQDPGEIEPIAVTTHEETGQLARAVDDLHRQAILLASGEAQLRAQVGDMFVTLSRRNTNLINQQLGLIEQLESDEEDPARLENLFRLDHLAARMRRNAESLVILSGTPTRAAEEDELSISDALQAAIAGVQDYRRVQLDSAPAQRISAEAAADVVHLLAELIDNALSYSPPSAQVLVTTTATRGGTVVQITDAGLGIADDTLLEINANLRAGGEVTPDTARRMGLFVVSRLAQRHNLSVTLEQNDRQGITATVFLPAYVMSDHARIEAGSTGGAQIIELGATQAAAEDEPFEADLADDQADDDADDDIEVAEPDRITAAINAYGLPQRSPGSSGAGQAAVLTPVGGGFFDAVPENGIDVDATDEAEDTEEYDDGEVAQVHTLPFAHDAGSDDDDDDDDDDDRVAIALGPVGTFDEADADEDESDEDESDENESDEMYSDEDDDSDWDDSDEEDSDEAVAESDESDEVAELDEVDSDEDDSDEDDSDEDDSDEAVAESDDYEVAELDELTQDDEAADTDVSDEDDSDEDDSDEDEVPAAELDEQDEEMPGLVALAEAARAEALAAMQVSAVPGNGYYGVNGGNGNGHAVNGNGNAFAHLVNGNRNGNGNGLHPVASENGDGVLDHANPRPASTEDDDQTPIFRSLSSNWLSATGSEKPWASSEVDAGWDAADRVEAAPPTRRTETGLPMRRPGNRLVPGGVTVAAAQAVRDPEAIRAKLAAHAAGVSRGRTAAGELMTDPSTQEAGPA